MRALNIRSRKKNLALCNPKGRHHYEGRGNKKIQTSEKYEELWGTKTVITLRVSEENCVSGID